MDELIRKVSDKTGVEEAVARQAVGAILAFLKSRASGRFDFDKIYQSIQGTEVLIKEAEEAEATSRKPVAREGEGGEDGEGEGEETTTVTTTTTPTAGPGGIFGLILTLMKIFGILAMLKQLVSTVFGEAGVRLIESVEDGAELTSVLGKLNINREQGIRMVRMLVDFLKEKLDSDTIDELVDGVPAVKAFMGESKKED